MILSYAVRFINRRISRVKKLFVSEAWSSAEFRTMLAKQVVILIVDYFLISSTQNRCADLLICRSGWGRSAIAKNWLGKGIWVVTHETGFLPVSATI